jgi:CRP-like cAMP-binding protein
VSNQALVNWLKSATELGMLPRDILEAIAAELVKLVVPAGRKVTIEDTPVTNLYILEFGQAERYRRKQPGLMWASGLLPGAVVNLSALQRSQLTDSRVVTLTECQFQTIPTDRWQGLVTRYPQITAAYVQRLAAKLEQLEGEIAYERDRQAALRPYLVPQAKKYFGHRGRRSNYFGGIY